MILAIKIAQLASLFTASSEARWSYYWRERFQNVLGSCTYILRDCSLMVFLESTSQVFNYCKKKKRRLYWGNKKTTAIWRTVPYQIFPSRLLRGPSQDRQVTTWTWVLDFSFTSSSLNNWTNWTHPWNLICKAHFAHVNLDSPTVT